MPATVTPFGQLLRQLRLRAGLSQAALAERAGITAAAVAALERGIRRSPHPQTLGALAAALELTVDERAGLASAARSPGARPVVETSSSELPVTNLPALRTTLIGREREFVRVCDLVASSASETRLVTLTGVGGVGKTSLALHVAHGVRAVFVDGVWLVELGQASHPGLIDRAVGEVVRAPEMPGQSASQALRSLLASKRVLLVLDNCEHVLDACAQLVEELLDGCPRLRVLTTSREPLLVHGEQQVRISPLALTSNAAGSPVETGPSPAVQLFTARAKSVTPDFALSPGNRPIVEAICARLDGLPLALELAAARVRILTPEQILTRLDDILGLLVAGDRAGRTRHQTLRSAMEWSYALLSTAEAAAFRRLSVFVGHFDLDAAEMVCAGDDLAPEEVLDVLMGLIDKSLVTVSSSNGPAAGDRLLEPVRQYASSRLRGTLEEIETHGRHADAYLKVAERAAPELAGANQAVWQQRLEADLPQFRSAFDWLHHRADEPRLVRLVLALGPFWEVRGHLAEGREWFERARDIVEPITSRASILLGLGRVLFFQVDLDEAAAAFEHAHALALRGDDHRMAARARTWLGAVARRKRDFVKARTLLEQGLLEHERQQDPEAAAFALYNLGCIENQVRGTEASVRLIEEARRRYRALGDVRFTAMTSVQLAVDLIDIGQPRRAPELVNEALQILKLIGDRVWLTSGLVTLGHAAARMRQPIRAAHLLGAAEGLSASLGQPLSPNMMDEYDGVMRSIRTQLPTASADAEVAVGRRMNLDDALAEARAMVVADQPAASRSHSTSEERLTERERQVMRLLERGLSDSQIARELSISPRTASVHVRSVLAKLELRSRWQVRDWVIAHVATVTQLT